MNKKKVLSLIGLATRAGKIQSGEFATEKAVKEGKANLVIVASDASDNTLKKFRNSCTYYKVPFYIYSGKEELGHGMGKENRASLAVCDKGFGDAIEKLLKQEITE